MTESPCEVQAERQEKADVEELDLDLQLDEKPGKSVLDHEENLIALHDHLVSGDRFNGRHAEGLAGLHVEPGSVAGALDLAAGEVPFRQRATVVCTDVVDCIEGAPDVEKGDGPAVHIDQLLLAGGHLRAVRHLDWFWHRSSLLAGRSRAWPVAVSGGLDGRSLGPKAGSSEALLLGQREILRSSHGGPNHFAFDPPQHAAEAADA